MCSHKEGYQISNVVGVRIYPSSDQLTGLRNGYEFLISAL